VRIGVAQNRHVSPAALDHGRDLGVHLGVGVAVDFGVHARVLAELRDQRVELTILGRHIRVAADDRQFRAFERACATLVTGAAVPGAADGGLAGAGG
jgi:3-keto-L-gulonate-6-phosphate decarboxylase